MKEFLTPRSIILEPKVATHGLHRQVATHGFALRTETKEGKTWLALTFVLTHKFAGLFVG
jgi:hypothetical protein